MQERNGSQLILSVAKNDKGTGFVTLVADT